ncbi:hypothetical protein KY5_1727 [Streptomyces formicae]|uniref:Lipoprotein n=1 Tax=Streptomyces formicae TaxID=1616117 RepID=A0A291Q5I2_9ACTN|nr:hypothetical protein KY5_1727 [Streptomyces formicae]
MNDRQWQPRKRWTGPEKWQVCIGLLGLLATITGCVGQFVQ